MKDSYARILKGAMDADNFAKLAAIHNDTLHAFIADAVELCQPAAVDVCTDDPADIAAIRQGAIENGEEAPLALEGHTVHFDGYPGDQGRDKEVTRYLVPAEAPLSKNLNQIEREKGLAEVRGFLSGAMKGRTMLVRFFCLGPTRSAFAIPCAQITDSHYVCHSEDLLYRVGYEEFRRMGNTGDFFRFLHSSGKLTANKVSAEMDKKRIYIDYTQEVIYSVNTQYAGNTVGLKKLALRLAIRKADREGWLAEHMFVMGIHGPKGRVTYFTGAFPSACGKTSTAMLPGETIVGDDLAYFRAMDGVARTVNVEVGIFGIISDVNATDDPLIYQVLAVPGEIIFTNVLVKDGKPYWYGMGEDFPPDGLNAAGQWHEGKIDQFGNEIPPANKGNARYTLSLRALANLDRELDNPLGVPVGGIIYGGRDSDTWVPVQQSFDWAHGMIAYGASLESETTAATLGATGVRSFNLMSNLDFLAISLAKYIQNNLDFAKALTRAPAIFAVNYFQKGPDGKFLTDRLDKAVWVKWMERRVHGEVQAIKAPTGWIPTYADLVPLFRGVLKKGYSREAYVQQFTIRIPENLAKLDRIERIYRQDVPDTPPIVLEVLAAQRRRLEALRKTKGDYVSPLEL
ncbi:MAG: phosphoenolpyruvate carboxykinase (GTP) [Phycisphaerae bacterium]|nr:phosphoenolpyruvate carboxykinase (GTP) [Phycisphaerae bacterium]